jgi:hypothetical protein
MRNIQSSNASADVDEETAEQLMKLIEASGYTPRQTFSESQRDGRSTLAIKVVGFNDVLRDAFDVEMWAVDYEDGNSREVEATPDRAAAEKRYEDLVRDAAGLLGLNGLGGPELFEYSDVSGVPRRSGPGL